MTPCNAESHVGADAADIPMSVRLARLSTRCQLVKETQTKAAVTMFTCNIGWLG